MSWKKSKDGGLDFDVEQELESRDIERRYEEAKKRMFGGDDNSATAHTFTFNTNVEHVEF